MSIPTTVSWPENWGINPDAFKSFAECMSALTAKFGEFQQQFYSVFVQHQRELPHLLTLMLTHSWYPDFNIPIADSRALEARAIAGDFPAVQGYLVEYFRSNAADIEKRISDLHPARSTVILEAFAAYRNGHYILAIPVFLAQADGISEDLLSKHFFIPSKSIPEAKKLLQDGKITDYGRLLLDPLVQSGTVRDHTHTLLSKTDYLNRHAIMHGIDLNYGTEINALKCISLLAYFLSVNTLGPFRRP